jgi:hypothetical protein
MHPDDQKVMYLAGGLGSLGLGFLVAALVISVVEAAVKSVYVCWAKAPGSFLRTHPELFGTLLQAWCKMYPAVSPVRTDNKNDCAPKNGVNSVLLLADDGELPGTI